MTEGARATGTTIEPPVAGEGCRRNRGYECYYALTTDGRMLEIGNGFAEAATGVSRIVDYNLAIMTDGHTLEVLSQI